MKKINKFVFLFSFSIFGFSAVVSAQNKNDEKRNVKQPPSLVVFDASQSYSLQNSTQILKEVLNPSSETSFTTLKQEQDPLGFTHQKMQEYYKGVKVEFGTVILHSKNGIVESLSNEFYEIQDFDVTPTVSNTQAFNNAVNHIGAQHYMWEYPDDAKKMDNYEKPKGELVIIPDFASADDIKEINAYRLAYKFDIFATSPVSRGYLYIDAKNGQPLFYDAIIKHATNFGFEGTPIANVETEEEYCSRINSEELSFLATGTAATRYSGSRNITTRIVGSTYALRDDTRGSGVNTYNSGRTNSYPTTNFTDADNNWSAAEFNNANKDNAALDAHWGAEATYDYWTQKHSRNSYNGSGAAINSYVHYDDVPGGLGYDNAFWNGSVMTYGDGSSNGNEGNGNFDALTSIDVAAHEIGHAVTTFTANLAYQRESGGLNEGFSDIWGAAVEHFAKGNGSDTNPAAAVWLIGDEIDRRSGSVALRSMSNPSSLGQPDTYGGQYWQNPNCGTPTQNNDYCGVHTNSGVLNHWFYRTVVGGSGTNDIGNTFTISGIGMTKSSNIAYRTLSFYLTANSTYANARTGAIQAAKDLYGAGSAEEIAVTNAWYAVGVGAAYGGGGGGSSYCASQGNSVNDEYISRVQLNTINNASGAQLYSDFTSISTTLNEGSSYTITVTPTWTGTSYDEGYAVWIDYNGDKDFADAGELVWSKAASKNTPNSGTFTVPAGTIGAATRMRVSMKYNGIPTACETFSYGEVEDYTINLGGAAPDTQAPTAPSNLVASNVTQTTLSLSWTASTDNVGVTGYDVFQGTTNIGTVTTTSTNITGLSPATAYAFKIRAHDAAGNNSGFSNIVNVTTLSNSVTYCTSKGNNTNDEYIDRVQLGSINNLSGNNGGYGNFTSISTTLVKGTSNTITITPRWTGTVYNEAYRVWIDYNQDGDFADSGEQVYNRAITKTTPISGSFTVPTSALNGPTRMRVSMKYNASPTSCETFSYGEVEDYTVNIGTNPVQGIDGGNSFSNAEMTLYPNPAKHTLNISLSEATGKNYVIYNTVGQVVGKGTYTESVDVSLLQGGIYMIVVNTENNKIIKRFVKE